MTVNTVSHYHISHMRCSRRLITEAGYWRVGQCKLKINTTKISRAFNVCFNCFKQAQGDWVIPVQGHTSCDCVHNLGNTKHYHELHFPFQIKQRNNIILEFYASQNDHIKDSLISDVTQSDRLQICVVQIQWASKIALSVKVLMLNNLFSAVFTVIADRKLKAKVNSNKCSLAMMYRIFTYLR